MAASTKELLFWKSIGGYLYAIRYRGKWWYVGNTYEEWRPIYDLLKECGYTFRRGPEPQTVQKIYRERGRTLGALAQGMPTLTVEQIRHLERRRQRR